MRSRKNRLTQATITVSRSSASIEDFWNVGQRTRLRTVIDKITAISWGHAEGWTRPWLRSAGSAGSCAAGVLRAGFAPAGCLQNSKSSNVAPVLMPAASPSSTLTVSLPPRAEREAQQIDLDAWELVWVGSLATEPTSSEPVRSHPKSVRTLHARAFAPRATRPVIVAQTTLRERPDTVGTRLVRWLTQHQAGKIWSPADTEGAG